MTTAILLKKIAIWLNDVAGAERRRSEREHRPEPEQQADRRDLAATSARVGPGVRRHLLAERAFGVGEHLAAAGAVAAAGQERRAAGAAAEEADQAGGEDDERERHVEEEDRDERGGGDRRP